MTKQQFMVFAFLAVLLLPATALADLPIPVGNAKVNDYINGVTPEQQQQLNKMAEDFAAATSIEIAVALVPSLEGKSSKQYAEQIGMAWGVGKQGRDNGIVLLWARKERAYYLKYADGLKPFISGNDAQRIMEKNFVPHFRKDDYHTGLSKTFEALIGHFGTDPWEIRVQKLKDRQAKEKDDAEKEQARVNHALVVTAKICIPAAVIIIVLFVYFGRKETRKHMKRDLQRVRVHLKTAEKNRPQVKEAIEALEQELPRQNTGGMRKDYQGQEARIKALQKQLSRYDLNDLYPADSDKVATLQENAETEANLLKRVRATIKEVKLAKTKADELFAQLSEATFKTEGIPKIKKGKEKGVRERLDKGQRKYQKAKTALSGSDLLDYAVVYRLLQESQTHIQDATTHATAVEFRFSGGGGDAGGGGAGGNWASGGFGSFGGGNGWGGGGGFGGTC